MLYQANQIYWFQEKNLFLYPFSLKKIKRKVGTDYALVQC